MRYWPAIKNQGRIPYLSVSYELLVSLHQLPNGELWGVRESIFCNLFTLMEAGKPLDCFDWTALVILSDCTGMMKWYRQGIRAVLGWWPGSRHSNQPDCQGQLVVGKCASQLWVAFWHHFDSSRLRGSKLPSYSKKDQDIYFWITVPVSVKSKSQYFALSIGFLCLGVGVEWGEERRREGIENIHNMSWSSGHVQFLCMYPVHIK